MPEDTITPARALARALAVLAFAFAAIFAVLTPAGDAAAQTSDRATIIYSATPTAVVSVGIGIGPLGFGRGDAYLVFVGTTAGTITATIIGITGTVDADGNNFRPLPEGATGTLFVTLDIVDTCSVNEGCGGRFGFSGNTPAERLASFITLDGASISMYGEAYVRYGVYGRMQPQDEGLLELVEGESLIYHLAAAGNDAQFAIVAGYMRDLAPKGNFDILKQGENEESFMHRAAININTVAISVFLQDYGRTLPLNPYRTAKDGRTPLMYLVSAALDGTDTRASATVALSILLSDPRSNIGALNITSNDGKSALDIAAERANATPPNPLAASVFMQLADAGAECALGTSPLCADGGNVGFQPDTPPNIVFVVRNDNNLTQPGLIGKVVHLDREGNVVVGLLSYPKTNDNPNNGKLNIKIKTATIILPTPAPAKNPS